MDCLHFGCTKALDAARNNHQEKSRQQTAGTVLKETDTTDNGKNDGSFDENPGAWRSTRTTLRSSLESGLHVVPNGGACTLENSQGGSTERTPRRMAGFAGQPYHRRAHRQSVRDTMSLSVTKGSQVHGPTELYQTSSSLKDLLTLAGDAVAQPIKFETREYV